MPKEWSRLEKRNKELEESNKEVVKNYSYWIGKAGQTAGNARVNTILIGTVYLNMAKARNEADPAASLRQELEELYRDGCNAVEACNAQLRKDNDDMKKQMTALTAPSRDVDLAISKVSQNADFLENSLRILEGSLRRHESGELNANLMKARGALDVSEKEKRRIGSELAMLNKREEFNRVKYTNLKGSYEDLLRVFKVVCDAGRVNPDSLCLRASENNLVDKDADKMWELADAALNAMEAKLEEAAKKMQDFSIRRFNCTDDYSYYKRIAALKSSEARIVREKLEKTTDEYAAFKERMHQRFGV